MSISVVSPVYRAEGLVETLVSRIVAVLDKLDVEFEIVLVDDGSPDASWDEISRVCQDDPRVKGVQLSRNFGQHYAITAGLDVAHGDWVVVMDCDLQDPPEEIPRLHTAAIEGGFDYVRGQRRARKDPFFKRLGSRMFYALLSRLSDVPVDAASANFGIYSRQVVDAVLNTSESNRFFPVMVRWVGFRGTGIPIEHNARPYGDSTYSLRKLMMLGLDIILSYSGRPLVLVLALGFSLVSVALIYAVVVLVQYLSGNITEPGYASLFISIWLMGGLIILVLGAVGLYVGKIFENAKGRPPYLIRSRLNC